MMTLRSSGVKGGLGTGAGEAAAAVSRLQQENITS